MKYRVLLDAGLLAVVLSFVAANPRGQVVVWRSECPLGTLAVFTYALSR